MKNNNLKLKTLNFALLLCVFSFAFYTPAVAAVSQLVFTTEPRTVAPGVISNELIVSSGEDVRETSDLVLVSSSATGEFLSESGGPMSEPRAASWHSNWKSRKFYYRDSTAGTYTLTATLTTRISQQSWSASQTITVGEGAPITNDNDNANSTTTQSTTNQSFGTGSSGILSAHENQAPLSQVASAEPFKIGAGRPRLASIHSPVIFRAESTEETSQGVRYQWSFGDGGGAMGEQATHIYLFPGEYNVVLNAVGQHSETAVSRTTVSVIQPTVMLGAFSVDRVEVTNRSVRELNLGDWRIIQGATAFTFPADTIVAAGKSTIVPMAYLGFSPMTNLPLTLAFPDAMVAVVSPPAPSREALEVMAQSLCQLSARLTAIKTSRRAVSAQVQSGSPSLARDPQPIPVTVTISSTATPPTSPASARGEQNSPTSGEGGLSAAVATIPVPKPPSFFARIRSWFGR